jgi:hypothetical protein
LSTHIQMRLWSGRKDIPESIRAPHSHSMNADGVVV